MPLLEAASAHHLAFSDSTDETLQAVQLSVPEKLDYFTALPLFADLLDELFEKRPIALDGGKKQIFDLLVRDALLEHAKFCKIPANKTIFQEGRFGENLYLILEGHVRTTTHVASNNEWHEVQLGQLQAGDFFGEMSALSMNAHLLTAATTPPTFLLLIPQFIVQELAVTQESFRTPLMQSYVQKAVSLGVTSSSTPALNRCKPGVTKFGWPCSLLLLRSGSKLPRLTKATPGSARRMA